MSQRGILEILRGRREEDKLCAEEIAALAGSRFGGDIYNSLRILREWGEVAWWHDPGRGGKRWYWQKEDE